MSDYKLEVQGIDDFMDCLTGCIEQCKESMNEKLQQVASEFKGDVIGKEKSMIKDNKILKQITKNDSAVIGKAKVNDDTVNVAISFVNSYFDLVENGYEQTDKNGQVTGWVEGNHIITQTCDSYENEVMPSEAEKLINQIMKESQLS